MICMKMDVQRVTKKFIFSQFIKRGQQQQFKHAPFSQNYKICYNPVKFNYLKFQQFRVFSTLVDKKLIQKEKNIDKSGLLERQQQQQQQKQQDLQPQKFWTIPTQLTLARIAMIPALIGCFYYPFQYSAIYSGSIFVIAAFTDWLDGYLARILKSESKFGAFLDPVADKLMVVQVLILLSTKPIQAGFFQGNDWILPLTSIIIISREIMMSALREWGATMGEGARKALEVSGFGKWKTATQMASLGLLLFIKDGGNGVIFDLFADIGVSLLGIACCLTVWSLILYLRGFWRLLSR